MKDLNSLFLVKEFIIISLFCSCPSCSLSLILYLLLLPLLSILICSNDRAFNYWYDFNILLLEIDLHCCLKFHFNNFSFLRHLVVGFSSNNFQQKVNCQCHYYWVSDCSNAIALNDLYFPSPLEFFSKKIIANCYQKVGCG